MNLEKLHEELKMRSQQRINHTVKNAMTSFRTLLTEIDCMSDEEIEAFQNNLHDFALKAVTVRREKFADAIHDSTLNFHGCNRL